MPLIAMTGTPGTGNTSAAEYLRQRGYEIIDLNAFIADNGLLGEEDAERDTREVDIESMRTLFSKRSKLSAIVEGHLSHFLGCDIVVVFRCHPDVLAERLRARGYLESKVRENVQAEILDVILCEADGSKARVFEIDTTKLTPKETAERMEEIIKGKGNHQVPGSTDWSGETDRWF